jgi:LytR cell envelope-related transcriptional attenuator
VIVGAGALAACRNERAGNNPLPIPGEGRGPHITVEVLNASGKPGLARVGTRVLRRAGIDVLTFGNAAEPPAGLDSTRIVVRRGGLDLGKRVRAALGVGRVVVQLDSARLLDASVFLGVDFAPTGLEFHP